MTRTVHWSLGLLAAALSGCAWITDDELKAREDLDQDGYASAQFGGPDCDDGDASVSPDATESCNSLDDDCDGAIDDVAEGEGITGYTDADADGYGDPATGAVACALPEGAVDNPLDCDDTNEAIHPDAAESCDGQDNDCDGAIDDDDDSFESQVWYPDADGDGVGGDGATLETQDCAAPTGYSATAGDCDDSDPSVAPGLPEVCDGLDNDCDQAVDDSDDDVTDVPSWYLDADGDGYGDLDVSLSQCDPPTSFVDDATDCDDTADSVHPGAPEHCDDIDEDCDGEADDSAVDVSTWYTDGDGDGWGDDGATTTACDAPTGTVAQGGDCDDGDDTVYPLAEEACTDADTNCDGQPGARDDDDDGSRGCDGDCDDEDPTVNPEADEICDGIDDDCDGLVDDDDDDRVTTGLVRYYPDTDGDAYGDADDAGAYACSLPAGRSETHSDCDDADGSVHPGAVEVCSTTADDDCDGSTSDCSATVGTGGITLNGVGEDDGAGSGLLCVDEDGDGWSALVVAAPGRSSAKGSVYVAAGPLSAGDSPYSLGDMVEWKGSAGSDRAGEALVVAGDADEDGLSDLAIGAPGGEAAYLLAGPASSGGGLTGADAVFNGPGEASDFGAALWLGDLDHDGHIDAAVGAPLQDQVVTFILTSADAGQVDLFWGPLSGDFSASGADGTLIDNDESNGRLGRALTGADSDGDGDDELVVSALDNNGLGTLSPRIYLLDASGGGAMIASDVERTFSGASGRLSGEALSAGGDVDGDGTEDLLVGDSDGGQAFLLLGPLTSAPTTLSGADAVITGSDDFGRSVALLDDLDGDGIDEVAVGGDNAVSLWMGGSGLTGAVSTSSADLTVGGARSADEAGAAVASGDLDGDGSLDLVVGAPGADSAIGLAWALLGPF